MFTVLRQRKNLDLTYLTSSVSRFGWICLGIFIQFYLYRSLQIIWPGQSYSTRDYDGLLVLFYGRLENAAEHLWVHALYQRTSSNLHPKKIYRHFHGLQ